MEGKKNGKTEKKIENKIENKIDKINNKIENKEKNDAENKVEKDAENKVENNAENKVENNADKKIGKKIEKKIAPNMENGLGSCESSSAYEALPARELFQIGQVSKLFHISISILRHYDKIGLLKPEYKDPDTGYRYYSTRQFECLNTIRYLRALDVPLEEIAAFVQNRNIHQIQSMLEKQRENVRLRQRELARIEKKIENRLNQLQDARSSRLDFISVEEKPSRRLALLKKDLLPRSYLDLERSIRELEQDEETSVTFLGKVGVGISRERLLQQVYQPYEIVFILLDEEDCFKGKTITLDEETCVTIRFQGGHDRAEGYYGKLMEYIQEHGYRISGFSKEITMIDYGITDDESQFVTEIQIPVKLEK